MCFPSSRCRLICSMSVTADRARGFLSAAGEQSNTPELPRSKWKLKDSIIIPNRWRANPPTHRIDDQTGDTLVYLKKKKRWTMPGWKGRKEWEEVHQSTQWRDNWSHTEPANTASHLPCSLPQAHSASDSIFSNVQRPLGTFKSISFVYFHINMLWPSWPRTWIHTSAPVRWVWL